jgi:hypothetical protein
MSLRNHRQGAALGCGSKRGPVEKGGQEHTVPLRRFQSWRDAEQYLVESGADTGVLQRTTTSLKQTGMAVLTIV